MFRFPQLKCDLNSLSVNVAENMITQSSKFRYLRVIFDQFLNVDDNIDCFNNSVKIVLLTQQYGC